MESVCDLFHRCLDRRHDDDWHEFTRRYHGYVRAALWRALCGQRRSCSSEDLDDYSQELYLLLLTRRVRPFAGRHREDLWCYLDRMAKNMVTDRWRRASSQRRRPPAEEEVAATLRSWASPTRSPEERFLVRERLSGFLARCRRIAGGRRLPFLLQVVVLYFVEGRTSVEVAEILAGRLTASQVNSFIHLLRRRLAGEGLALSRRRVWRTR